MDILFTLRHALAVAVSWLPAWTTLAASGALLLAGLAAVVWSRLPLAAYRTLTLIGGLAALYASAWLAGAGNMRAVAERAALEQQLADSKAMAAQRSRELAAAQGLVASLEADAQAQAQHAEAARARERETEAAAAALAGGGSLGAEASRHVLDLWR